MVFQVPASVISTWMDGDRCHGSTLTRHQDSWGLHWRFYYPTTITSEMNLKWNVKSLPCNIPSAHVCQIGQAILALTCFFSPPFPQFLHLQYQVPSRRASPSETPMTPNFIRAQKLGFGGDLNASHLALRPHHYTRLVFAPVPRHGVHVIHYQRSMWLMLHNRNSSSHNLPQFCLGSIKVDFLAWQNNLPLKKSNTMFN